MVSDSTLNKFILNSPNCKTFYKALIKFRVETFDSKVSKWNFWKMGLKSGLTLRRIFLRAPYGSMNNFWKFLIRIDKIKTLIDFMKLEEKLYLASASRKFLMELYQNFLPSITMHFKLCEFLKTCQLINFSIFSFSKTSLSCKTLSSQ